MPIGTYSDYSPAGSSRVFRVPIGASAAHGPENFTTFADKLEESLAGALLNAQTGTTYTFALADAGKVVTGSNAAAQTYTVPPNSSVGFLYGSVGACIQVMSLGAGLMTMTPGAGVTINGSDLVLAQYESGTLIKTAINTWVFTKGGGLPKAIASGGTETTYSASGKNYKSHKFTAGGTLTVSRSGMVEFLLVSGGSGGGGEYANDGSGGGISIGMAYLVAGSYTVVIGAGSTTTGGTATGNPGGVGGYSRLGDITSAVMASYNTTPHNAPLTNNYEDGSNKTYSAGGQTSVVNNTGNGGDRALCCSGRGGINGASGVVIVRYET